MITETKLTMAEVLSPVRDGLKAVEDRLSEYGPDQHEALTAATNHLLASGGKRIRPAMSLLAAAVFDADPDQAVYVAASIEMLHTATLVHDDLIDGSLLRRGIPTLNANWTPGATVLTGDHLFARAADLAAHADSVRVMRIFARTLMVLVNGEINQMFKSKGIASRDDYYRRIYAKTASVFEAAAEAGAVAAHAAEDDIAALATYGREVGSAFQIVDDILDFVGDPAHIGKPVGGDLRQGLVTLPTLCYMEERPHDADVRALLNGRMGDAVITARVVEAVRASSAIRAALAEARQFVARGLSALDSLPPGQPVESLRRLAEYVVSRDL
ncbi:MAG: polyprenyl synthetase family protein [Chloroflexi bacterium]|nr:polyprenyl synthetase family protein [Chloroflexota bacterium]